MALLNRTIFNATSGGLSDFVVASPVQGYMTPSQSGAVDSTVYSYSAQTLDPSTGLPNQWEIGEGTYIAATTTLQRTSVTNSSNSDTLVNFATPPQVMISALVVDFVPGQAGPQGFMGMPGMDGSDGDDGSPVPGPQGAQGPQGLPGNDGAQGIQGFGIDGLDGEDGQSIPGPQGIQGVQGIQGNVGNTGPQGIQGNPGADGTDGEEGLTIPGPTGPQGPQGTTGNTGATGSQGIQGFGTDGLDGEDGQTIPGPQGSQGSQGATGPQGLTANFIYGAEDGLDGTDFALGTGFNNRYSLNTDAKNWTFLGTATGATVTVGPVTWTGQYRQFLIQYLIAGYSGGTPIGRLLLGSASISTTALTNSFSLSEGVTAPSTGSGATAIPGLPLAVTTSAIGRMGFVFIDGASGSIKTLIANGVEGTPSVATAPVLFRGASFFSDLGTNLLLQRAQLSVYDTLTSVAVSANTFTAGTQLVVWGRNND
jgi:hypothetical protein